MIAASDDIGYAVADLEIGDGLSEENRNEMVSRRHQENASASGVGAPV